jgi:hypothetical protein
MPIIYEKPIGCDQGTRAPVVRTSLTRSEGNDVLVRVKSLAGVREAYVDLIEEQLGQFDVFSGQIERSFQSKEGSMGHGSGARGKAFLRSGADDQLSLMQKGSGLYIMTASTGVQVAQEKESDEYGFVHQAPD